YATVKYTLVSTELSTPTDWSSGLCDCFEDISACCYGFWCSPCLACSVSGQFGENFLICDVPLFAPPTALSMRSAMRNKYGIKGSLCKDIAVSCFCVWCSWCQMHSELKHRKKTPVIINLSLRDGVRCSVIREGLRVDPLLLHIEKSQLR
uniref:Plac8 onzin related protein 2 n=1 Tax=Nothobranchius furzeri TaxID=105023 RepID=A0A8C6L3R3_NOTFU